MSAEVSIQDAVPWLPDTSSSGDLICLVMVCQPNAALKIIFTSILPTAAPLLSTAVRFAVQVVFVIMEPLAYSVPLKNTSPSSL